MTMRFAGLWVKGIMRKDPFALVSASTKFRSTSVLSDNQSSSGRILFFRVCLNTSPTVSGIGRVGAVEGMSITLNRPQKTIHRPDA